MTSYTFIFLLFFLAEKYPGCSTFRESKVFKMSVQKGEKKNNFCILDLTLGHSLRLNAGVVARALGSLVVEFKIILQVIILFFMGLVRNLQKQK